MTLTDNEVVEHMAAADERCRLCCHHAPTWSDGSPRSGGSTCNEFRSHPARPTVDAVTVHYSHARVADLVCNRDNVVMPAMNPENALLCGRVLAEEPPCRLFNRSVPRENHDATSVA